MLSTTMPQSPVQTQSQANTDVPSSSSAVGVAIGIGIGGTSVSSPKTVKSDREPFPTMSPDQSKILTEEICENIGAPSNDNSSTASTGCNGNGGAGGVGTGVNNSVDGQPPQSASVTTAAGPAMLRQNSSSSINSCLATSPNNTSEHSNSSNLSAAATLTHMAECDLVQQDENAKKKKISIKEEDTDNVPNKSKSYGPGVGSVKVSTSGLPIGVSIKEEPTDVLSSLVNMKKEERDNRSPNLSPLGYRSISNVQDNSDTPVKIEMINNSTEKSSSLTLNNDEMGMDGVSCKQLSTDLTNEASNNPTISSALVHGMNSSQSTGLGPITGVASGTSPGGNNMPAGTGGMGNCLDYMQHQNHIFVFSTQLANKGAESVLNGQFQTIIAYHCTQPATKSFLEDFFIKNPLKMNKLQRHSSLGMPWIGIGHGGSMVSNAPNPVTKIVPHSKPSGSLQKNQVDVSKRIGLNAPNSIFVEQSNALANENDLMCWESGAGNTSIRGNVSGSIPNSRNSLDASNVSGESQALKLLEAAGVDLGQGLKGSDPCLTHESNFISLQGVKVPDENLTPQQRQHREEQLAKIKKMNQFLFPENENTIGANQMVKLPGDLMMGVPSGGGASILNPQVRQTHLSGNVKPEHLTGPGSGLAEDVLLPVDVMVDIGSAMGCNNSQKNIVHCGTVITSTPSSINVNMQCANSGATNGNLIGNSTDLVPSFGNTTCNVNLIAPGTDVSKCLSNQESSTHPHQAGVSQMEWSKIQQQFFDDRLKGGKLRQGVSSVVSPQQSSGNGGTSSNNQVRSLQGPPPPYHSTQRSASVPIASQSPNPSSPNNLSLPSPRTTNAAMGLPSNSPNMEASLPGSASSAIVSTSGTGHPTSQANTVLVLPGTKNCFQGDAPSPSNQNPNLNRNRNNGSTGTLTLNLNSNPGTPLSHISPKELEPFGQTSTGDNIKNRRPSPQAPRSPGNGLIDANVESRFAASSPGLIFNHHPHHPNNGSSALSAYKLSNPNIQLERQSSNPGSSIQFNRRSDHIPLNPNSGNRPPPNKMPQNFDPISSLAQMSQQLTSCVSSMGSPAGTGGISMMGAPGTADMNIEHGMISGLDATGLDAMNPNNCHPMNSAMISMGQRMLNPKICGSGGPGAPPGFNLNSPNGVIRELGPGPGSGPVSGHGPANSPNFQGVLPPGARLMGRMPVNFGSNFNPNIQVKASTPNTIQYMPVRPQNSTNNNNNGSSNVRMPPSLEFLQRYTNPQMGSVGNGSSICAPHGGDSGSGLMLGSTAGSIIMNSPGDQQQNKIVNNPGAGNGINFFQNCNQLTIMDEECLAGHDVGMGIGQPSMIRGMRPHGMRSHAMGPRMQATVNRPIQFAHAPDGLDCVGDTTATFNSACNTTGPAVFASQQSNQTKPQHLKTITSGMCQNPAAVQGQMQLQGQGQVQPLMGPNNNTLMSTGGNSGPPNGVTAINFVGPSSNDLKYAQQYHSFQQQLYATNTRSQQQQQMHQQQGNIIAMPPNLSPNPAFFVNK